VGIQPWNVFVALTVVTDLAEFAFQQIYSITLEFNAGAS
jgi:hypothetical protein